MMGAVYYGLLAVGYILMIVPPIVLSYKGNKLNKENFTTQLFIPQCIGLILMFVGIMGAFAENTDAFTWQIITVITASGSALYSITAGVLSINIIRWRAD
jgi:hypothetical protein